MSLLFLFLIDTLYCSNKSVLMYAYFYRLSERNEKRAQASHVLGGATGRANNFLMSQSHTSSFSEHRNRLADEFVGRRRIYCKDESDRRWDDARRNRRRYDEDQSHYSRNTMSQRDLEEDERSVRSVRSVRSLRSLDVNMMPIPDFIVRDREAKHSKERSD